MYVTDDGYRNQIHSATSADALASSLSFKEDTPQAALTWNSYSVSKVGGLTDIRDRNAA